MTEKWVQIHGKLDLVQVSGGVSSSLSSSFRVSTVSGSWGS